VVRDAGWKIVVAVVLVAVAVALLIGGASDGARHRSFNDGHVQAERSRASVSAASRVRPPSHIAVIVMENEGYGDVIGSPAAPFISALARRYALARHMYAVSHPSLPNYLALTGGSTFGISSDCTACTVPATGLADQLQVAGISWKAYMEGLPRPCFTGPEAGEYAKKHDPFVYYTAIARHASACAQVVPMTELGRDERSGALPRFIWITPNLCHDMHDCGVVAGDRFLAGLVPRLLRALGSNGLLFLTWDEGVDNSGCCRAASGGHIATIVAGPRARPGARLNTPSDHYSLLQTVEDLLGLPRLRAAGCRCTPSLEPLLIGH
jgi:hypothetical protein